jgi:NCAIR mutase (PurE)-related protein
VDLGRLRDLLALVQSGTISPDEAVARLRRLPYEDLGYARLDTHRAIRSGAPETVYCPGKSADQVVGILARLAESHANVLATRATPEMHAAALLTMLATCVPGIAVVNIDNGFGAACLADRINKLAAKIR